MVQFANNFYLECVKEKPGNVIVSPLSVETTLVLLSQGADGNTFEQLKTGFHLSNNKASTANQFLKNSETLEKCLGESTLSIANRIYVQQGHQLNKNFQNVAVSKFKSGIESLNFDDSEKSAAVINHFVEEKTNGKIKELIKPSQLDSNTSSLLVNAIYFKGNWETPFEEEFTKKGDFYNSETEKVSVDFMYMNSEFNVANVEELSATALEMNYANSNISFVIVLPNDRFGLTALETKLKNYDLTKITNKFDSIRCAAFIPKFKVEYEIKLNNVLKNMGMTGMFTNEANLSGISESTKQMKVSDVVHKVFIEIDEKGTEAAGGTGSDIRDICLPEEFCADHPFMYFIRETTTNTIIFSGRINNF